MNIEFLKSIYNFKDYKDYNLPELAFAGRSNVGKSSLINTLVNRKIAHTSKIPGKTRSINFYKIDNKLIFVDLPGYGYAKISKEAIVGWKELVESYITQSKNLKMIFLLVDISRGLEEEEHTLIDWLSYLKKPYKIIFTKIDKLSKSQLYEKIKEFSSLNPLFFSSKTKEGKSEFFKFLKGAL